MRKVASKKQIWQVFLPLKEPFVALLNKTCALTSEANVAKKVMTIPNLFQSYFALNQKGRAWDYFALNQKGGVWPKEFQYFWSI